HWDIYPQLNIVKIPLKKLFSLVLTIHNATFTSSKLKNRFIYRHSLYSAIKLFEIMMKGK
uniref:hypothetical protein n=1 Tax=Turicibacter sanguinis TaxID=154288 RepID=UPI001E4B102D